MNKYTYAYTYNDLKPISTPISPTSIDIILIKHLVTLR